MEIRGSDLFIRMLHPSLYSMLLNGISDYINYLTSKGDVSTVNLCNIIKDLPKDPNGITTDLLHRLCELHDVAPIIIESIDINYNYIHNASQPELTIIGRLFRKVIAAYRIQQARDQYHNDPLKLLEAIKSIEVPDNTSEDPDVYRESNFLDYDIKKVQEASGTVIPSCLSVVNDNTPGGYLTGQLVVFSGAPGCFFGDTEVMTLDHSKHTLEELYHSGKKNIEVYCCDEYGSLRVSKAEECKLTKYINDYVEVNIDGKIIKCTPDHPFMLNDGAWVQAINLLPNDSLKSVHIDLQSSLTPQLIADATYPIYIVSSVTLCHSDEPIPVYDLVNVDKYHDYAIYIDGDINEDSGVIVHNSGKTLTMINESVSMALNGVKVHYTAIGDMNELDFANRISGIVLDTPMSAISLNQEEYYNILRTKHEYLRNIKTCFMAPDKFTVTDYTSKLRSSGDWDAYDVFVIDYDTNFASTRTDSMYAKGDEIYNELKLLASRPGKLVLLGAQPKINTWMDEILELSSLSESSRKQQIIDMLITISHPATPNGANHVGIINVAKNRRGSNGSCPYFMDKTGKIRCIQMSDYNYFKTEDKPFTLSKNLDGKSMGYKLGDAARANSVSLEDTVVEPEKPVFTIPGVEL